MEECCSAGSSKQKCTPFLGPETCFDFSIPSASVLADEWANEHDYPFEDRRNLPRVAQFVAYKVSKSVDAVKEIFAEKFHGLKLPDFPNPDEPYRILASLPLNSIHKHALFRVHVTSVDVSATKNPSALSAAANDLGVATGRAGPAAACDPKPACPLVYHMFGHVD